MSEIQSPNWNEVAANNTAAIPNGIPPGGPGFEIYDWGREVMAAVKRDWDRNHTTLSSTGSADAYALTYTAAPPAYADGLRFAFKANFVNSGPATCNVNSLGAKPILKNGATGPVPLAAGDIQTNNHVVVEYDLAADALILLNPLGVGAPVAGPGISVSGTTVSLDIHGLAAETVIAANDEIAIYDVSAGAQRRIARSDLVTGLGPTAGTGIGVAGTSVSLAPNGLTTVTAAADDYLVLADASDFGNPKKALVSDVTPVAGAGIAVAGTTVSLAPTGLTAVAPAQNDYLVIADTSDLGNPKKVLVSDLPAAIPTSGNLRQLTRFTASGIYTKPSWLKFAIVELVGGGGGGGGAQAATSVQNEGGGGGGGGYAMKKIAAAAIGATETVTVGSGGTGGIPAAGTPGGTTSFGALCSATGGNPGTGPTDFNQSSSGGTGGMGTGGDVNLAGESGGGGIAQLQTVASWSPNSSEGGSSRLGFGVKLRTNGGNSFGPRGNGLSAAANTGGGGKGGYEAYSNTNYMGGAGGSGVVLVWEYE